MRRAVLAAALALIVFGSFLPVMARAEEQSCATIKADCSKVELRIRQIWPDNEENHAIECFSNESGLFKWSGRKSGSQYKGIAQMSKSLRAANDWGWEIVRQLKAAFRVWKWHQENATSAWQPWYAPGC